VFQFSDLQTALGNSAAQAQVIQTAYNSSQQELEELQVAALEACQGIEEGEAQTGSSVASHLHALGGHVTQRMRRALHLGVHKALGVVVSHYRVNLGAMLTVKFRQPSHEFTFGVGMNFISYPLVLTPVV
jgi:hypothetical protein